MSARRIEIPVAGTKEYRPVPKSLCWVGDELVDWVSGGGRFRLDGSFVERRRNYAYIFDRAIASPCGKYSVLFVRLGTKGLILKHGEDLREINRSYYQAHVYEYPVAFVPLPDGRTGLAHCPDEYCKLEIEDVETGARLTARDSRCIDFFHSRLTVSPSGRYLASAGWVWHPLDDVFVYDVQRALVEPRTLDRPLWHDSSVTPSGGPVELEAAAFGTDDSLYLCSMDEPEPPDANLDLTAQIATGSIGIYDLTARRFRLQAKVIDPEGTLMPVDATHVVGFFGCPKLIDLSTGKVECSWEDLQTGKQVSSICRHLPPPPPVALDIANRRFAVASEEKITVVQLS